MAAVFHRLLSLPVRSVLVSDPAEYPLHLGAGSEDDWSSVVTRLQIVAVVAAIAERERSGFPAAAELDLTDGLHFCLDVLDVNDLDALGRLARRHCAPAGVNAQATLRVGGGVAALLLGTA